MTARRGTCVEDAIAVPIGAEDRWLSTCGHGYAWRMGDLKNACHECVGGRCDHPKAGIEFEQGRML